MILKKLVDLRKEFILSNKSRHLILFSRKKLFHSKNTRIKIEKTVRTQNGFSKNNTANRENFQIKTFNSACKEI